MRIAIIFMAILVTALGFSAPDAVAKDEVYRWVDEDGVVHYSNLPGEQDNAEPVTIRKSRGLSNQPASTPAAADPTQLEEPQPSYAQQQRDERARIRKEAALRSQEIAAGCAQRRQLVAQLEPSTRVMITLEDGSVIRMDDNERLETLAEAKDYIAEKCDK
jgi:hypothetical protein